MSKSVKWSCGLCTYENYPASVKCVMCSQPCPTPLIHQPSTPPDIIQNLPSDVQNNHGTSISQHGPIQDSDNDSSPKFIDQYQEIISTELGNKLRICHRTEREQNPVALVSGEDMIICGAGATSGPSDPRYSSSSGISNKNNEINKKWACPNCTYANWDRSLKCVMCHHPKPCQRIIDIGKNEQSVPMERSLNANSTSREAPCNSSNYEDDKNKNAQHGAIGCLARSPSIPRLPSSENNINMPHFRIGGNASAAWAQKKSLSDENLINIMNNQTSLSSHHRQIYDERGRLLNQDTVGKSTSYNEKLSKCRDHDYSRSWKKSNKRLNWLFLKACVGVLEDNLEAVDRYISNGGNIARPLSADEVNLLNRPSAFDVGHTLVHLAVRFQRHNMLALILTPEVAKRNLKRSPAILCPEIADHIRHEIMNSIRVRKGDFHCQYFCDYLTFLLPIEIAGLPSSIQRLLFDELLDKDVQKELEDEGAINWCADTDRLYALWNRSAGDCLLDSVLQSTWGVFDRDNVLRCAMSETMQECSPYFYARWKEWELTQASLLNFSLSERQCLQDWGFLLSLARQPGASLEHCHIFVLSHILRRPVIVYGVKYLKSFQGDTLGFAKFQGVYLPFLWDRSFCWKSPIALGYTRGHFTGLVPMENDSKDPYSGSQDTCSEAISSCTYLPLMDCERKLLPIHFTSANQAQADDQQECILYEWLDCLVTSSGVLVAKQKPGKRPPLVTRMLDQWLDHYRHLSFRRLGEDGETEDEE